MSVVQLTKRQWTPRVPTCTRFTPRYWTVLPLMLYICLAPFRNQSQNLLKPPKGIGSDKAQGRKCLFAWAFLTTAEEMQRSQLFAGHYISGLAPSAAFLGKWGYCLAVPPSITGKRTVSLLCQRMMQCFSLKNTKSPSPDIEWGPFQHLPHKPCYHTGYYFAFGVNSWFCIFLAHQPDQWAISARLAAVLHGLLLYFQCPVAMRCPAQIFGFHLCMFFLSKFTSLRYFLFLPFMPI